MSSTDASVVEDDLHAMVDGQLESDRLPAVLAWLQAHPDDALRVAQWQSQRQQLRQLSRNLDVGPTPPALTEGVLLAGRRKRWRAAGPQAAAAVALLALGVAGGRWWAGQGGAGGGMAAFPAFVREAAVAHAVFTPERRHPVEVTAAEEAHLVQWLGRRLGAPLKAPVLLDRGFRLLGGRLLPGDPVPRAQFMYEDASGRRLTLFVAVFAPGKAPAETSFRSVKEGSRESFYWVEGTFGYALSGDLPAGDMQVLAREVYAKLAR